MSIDECKYLAANFYRTERKSFVFKKLVETLCGTNLTFFDGDKMVELIEKSAFNSSELFVIDGSEILPSRILTFRGMCYSINMLNFSSIFNSEVIHKDFQTYSNNKISEWSIERGYFSPNVTYPSRHGTKLCVYLNKTDAVNSWPNNFIKINFHFPNEIPTPSHKTYSVEYGSTTTYDVKVQSHRYDKGMKSVPIAWRKCYFDGEKILKYFRSYTKFHCEIECESNATLKLCGCAEFWMPRDSSTRVCNWLKDNCTVGILSEDPCACYSTCNDIKYSFEFNRMSIMLVGTKYSKPK